MPKINETGIYQRKELRITQLLCQKPKEAGPALPHGKTCHQSTVPFDVRRPQTSGAEYRAQKRPSVLRAHVVIKAASEQWRRVGVNGCCRDNQPWKKEQWAYTPRPETPSKWGDLNVSKLLGDRMDVL